MYQTYLRATDNDDYTNANRSMESIAKHLGMFVDKKEIKQEFSSMTGSSDDDVYLS